MNAAGGVLRGGNGSIGHMRHAVAVGEHASAALCVGRNGAVSNIGFAAGDEHRRTHAVEAGAVAAGAVAGIAGDGHALGVQRAIRYEDGVLVRAGRGVGTALQGSILTDGCCRVIAVGLAASAAGAALTVRCAVGRGTLRSFTVGHFGRIALWSFAVGHFGRGTLRSFTVGHFGRGALRSFAVGPFRRLARLCRNRCIAAVFLRRGREAIQRHGQH